MSLVSSRNQSRCNAPNSSVLFAGNPPTLTGLDDDMWASQLLTLMGDSVVLNFSFTGTPGYAGVERVELTMFNCPEWGIFVQDIYISPTGSAEAPITTTCTKFQTSCVSLVTVRMPYS